MLVGVIYVNHRRSKFDTINQFTRLDKEVGLQWQRKVVMFDMKTLQIKNIHHFLLLQIIDLEVIGNHIFLLIGNHSLFYKHEDISCLFN